MAAQNLVLLTKLSGGKQFKVQTQFILQWKAITGSTLIEYVNQRGEKTTEKVTESVSAINALTGGRSQAVTLFANGQTIYIISDNIIYLKNETFGTRIVYDTSCRRKGKYQQPPIFIDVTESMTTINTAAGNTGILVPSAGRSFYVNGDRICTVTHDPNIPTDFQLLYDEGKTEYKKITVNSTGNAFSIGSSWS